MDDAVKGWRPGRFRIDHGIILRAQIYMFTVAPEDIWDFKDFV